MTNFKTKVPEEVQAVWQKLLDGGYETYLVGGCVRDLVLGRTPKDWDLTTNAKPEEMLTLFGEQAFYENAFGTVGVKTDSEDLALAVIEVTTFRVEGKYSDYRRPDEVKFAQTLAEDLGRRDFTINALALDIHGQLVDPLNGLEDLKAKRIRTVGSPEARFKEDALRLVRAVRLAIELDCVIEARTLEAIQKSSSLLSYIARERIRDEFVRIMMQPRAMEGVELLRLSGLLIEIIPELIQAYGVGQNKHHTYDVYEHLLRSLDYAAEHNHPLELRLAALLHDIGKPVTKQGEGADCTFYHHEVVGAKLAKHILVRLKFSNQLIKDVTHLIRHHMFYMEIEEVTPAAVRRFVKRVGQECLESLFQLRESDRIGSGVPKAVPYRMRYLRYLIKKAHRDPITPSMLQIGGQEIINILAIQPGPRVGWVLKALLEEVLEEPKKNKPDYLEKRVKELGQLSDEELRELALGAEEKKKEIEEEIDKQIKEEFKV